jgi:hypothetical protein
MKSALPILILLLGLLQQPGPSEGGATATSLHGIWLSWRASPAATWYAPGAVNVYRSTSTCAAATTFTLQTPQATAWGPWHDPAAVSGTTYCYETTAVIAGTESTTYSNQVQVTAP